MKTLVIVAHPDLEKSVVNRRWVDEAEKHPEHFTVHRLYQNYPDEQIDIAREQALVEQHGTLVLQFPIYWFGCPSLLKNGWIRFWLSDGPSARSRKRTRCGDGK